VQGSISNKKSAGTTPKYGESAGTNDIFK